LSCYRLLAFISLRMELHWRANPVGKVRPNLPFFKEFTQNNWHYHLFCHIWIRWISYWNWRYRGAYELHEESRLRNAGSLLNCIPPVYRKKSRSLGYLPQ